MLAFTLLSNFVFSKNIYAVDKDKIEKTEEKVVEVGSKLPYPKQDSNQELIGYIENDVGEKTEKMDASIEPPKEEKNNEENRIEENRIEDIPRWH